MEKYVWLQLLGAILMGLVFILFIILPAVVELARCFFDSNWPKRWKNFYQKTKKRTSFFFQHTKIIKGKILNLVVQKTILEGKIFNLDFHIIVEDNNGKIKEVNIPKKVFAELNEKRKFSLKKNIVLYFKGYFFNDYFDHYEIA